MYQPVFKVIRLPIKGDEPISEKMFRFNLFKFIAVTAYQDPNVSFFQTSELNLSKITTYYKLKQKSALKLKLLNNVENYCYYNVKNKMILEL